MGDWYGRVFERRPGAVAVFVLLVSALTAWGLTRPEPESGYGDDDALARSLAVESAFRLGGHVVLVLEAPDVFAPAAVAALADVADAVGRLRDFERPITPDLIPGGARERSPWPRPDADDAEREAARAAAHAHPLVAGWLLSDDDRTLALPVVWSRAGGELEEPWDAQLLRVARAAAGTAFQVRLTGPGPVLQAQSDAFARDHDRFRIIAVVVVAVLAAFLFRSSGAVLVAGAAPIVGVLWAFAAIRVLGLEMSGYTQVVLPILLSMIGFTDSVHVCMHLRARRAAGVAPRAAAREALGLQLWPCLLTSLTTAVGFGSLARASATSVRDFGLGAAAGTLCAFAAVMTVTPLLSLTPLGRGLERGHARDLPGRRPELYARPLRVVLSRPRSVALAAVLVTAALALAALGLRPDNRLAVQLPEGSEAYEALAHCDEALGGAFPVMVHVEWDADVDAASWLDVLAEAEELVAEEPLLATPLSALDLLELVPSVGPRAARLPWLAAAPPALLEMLYLPEQRAALVLSRVRDLGIATYEPVFDELEGRLATLERPGVRVTLTGGPVVFGRYVSLLVRELGESLLVAAVVILVMLGIAFRSWRLGLAGVVPNLFPLAITGGLLVALGGRVEVAYVTAFTLCLGIAVDDTVHLMVRYKRERARGASAPDSVRVAVGGVASALWVTTIIMVAGFMTLTTSPLPANQAFGWMAGSTLLAAWVADMLLLPAFLVLLDRRR